MKKKYTTIGFFGPRLDAQYQIILWKGIVEKAKKEGVNLIYFPGEKINSRYAFEYQANIVYKLAGKENIDGLIVLANIIGIYLPKNEMRAFCLSYLPLPIVSVGISLAGIPSVEVDNSNGIRQLISHLVQYHHYRRFAFICGPRNNEEVEDRIVTLRDVLQDHGLDLDDELIVAGDFFLESGAKAVKVLVEKQNKSFDVIIAANDYMAIGALEALRLKGINVPEDVAVTGFDDIQSSSYCTPPLTTVYQPILEKGRKAMEIVLALLSHKKVKERTMLPTKLVIRESCGCFHHDSGQLPFVINAGNREDLHKHFTTLKRMVVKESNDIIGFSMFSMKKYNGESCVTQLIDAFYNDLKNNSPESFISQLNRILRFFVSEGQDVFSWHRFISILRDNILKYKLTQEEILLAEYLREQAGELIGEISQRYQGYKLMEAERLSRRLWEFGNALITSLQIP
jgi:DNA-binding LacI/PurR family transcriptional regulator